MTSTARYDKYLSLLAQVRQNRRMATWLLTAVLCYFLAYVARLHEVTHDVFHEMALAREAFVAGFPTVDVFSFTSTVNPTVHHEWGTGAILYWATAGSGLGLWGLSALRMLLMALMWLALYRTARLRGAKPIVFALFSAIVFPMFWVGFSTVRAQMFTLVFIAIQLWLQERDWRGSRAWLVGWALMMIVWLNIHAGFVVGVGLMGIHLVERTVAAWASTRRWKPTASRVWHLGLVPAIVLLILPLNPYSWEYVPYLFKALTMPRPTIMEWQPLWRTYAAGPTLLAFAVSVALIATSLSSQRRRTWVGIGALGLCAWMTLLHIRHGSIYGVLWIAYVPAWISRAPWGHRLLGEVRPHAEKMTAIAQGVAAASLAFAIVNHFWLPTLPGRPVYSSFCYPTDAVEYLKQCDFRGNLLTPFNAGAYVSWEMYPRVRVSLDGRYEVAYSENVMRAHDRFYDGDDGWYRMLDQYPADAVLIPQTAAVRGKLEEFRQGATNELELPTEATWHIAYEDDSYAVLDSGHCWIAVRLPVRRPAFRRGGGSLLDRPCG